MFVVEIKQSIVDSISQITWIEKRIAPRHVFSSCLIEGHVSERTEHGT